MAEVNFSNPDCLSRRSLTIKKIQGKVNCIPVIPVVLMSSLMYTGKWIENIMKWNKATRILK